MDVVKSGLAPLFSGCASCFTALVIHANLVHQSAWFNDSPTRILLAGYLASWCFIFTLTALSNLEMCLFGKDFQSKFPEIILAFLFALYSCLFVQRVAVTVITCILCSIIGLHHLNRISQKYHNRSFAYNEPVPQVNRRGGKQKFK